MKFKTLIGVVTLLGATAAASAATPDVDAVLAALHDRGKDLKSFTADVTMTTEDMVRGGDSTDAGVAIYQGSAGGDARFHLRFDTHQLGTSKPKAREKEYLLEHNWLVDRSYDIRNETRYQVAPPGQKVNLFQLGEGPFPLPIGQDKADVHKLFNVTIIAPDAKTDPAGPATAHLKLEPKPDTPFARRFEYISVWVDAAKGMPVRIETMEATNGNETSRKTTDLSNLRVNPPVTEADFKLPAMVGEWRTAEKSM